MRIKATFTIAKERIIKFEFIISKEDDTTITIRLLSMI